MKAYSGVNRYVLPTQPICCAGAGSFSSNSGISLVCINEGNIFRLTCRPALADALQKMWHLPLAQDGFIILLHMSGQGRFEF